jgi:putative Holliday junction resolvase
MGTVLAFDFGEKRIGVATGETLLGSAHPLTVIHAESNDDRFAAIGKLIAEWQPEQPGGRPADPCRRHAARNDPPGDQVRRTLKKRFNLPVSLPTSA